MSNIRDTRGQNNYFTYFNYIWFKLATRTRFLQSIQHSFRITLGLFKTNNLIHKNLLIIMAHSVYTKVFTLIVGMRPGLGMGHMGHA